MVFESAVDVGMSPVLEPEHLYHHAKDSRLHISGFTDVPLY